MKEAHKSLAWIDPNEAESGELLTGFEKGDDRGSFSCGNCIHMKDGACVHPVMVRMSGQPKEGDGVEVDDDDCCKYQRRPEKKKEGKKKDGEPNED